MADFNIVHRDALREARRQLDPKKEDRWTIALRTPIKVFGSKIETCDETVTAMHIKLNHAGKLCPADQGSMEALRDWKVKYKDTPDNAFTFSNGDRK